MSNKIVARLRDLKNGMNECGFTDISAVVNAATDEIERLHRDYSCICSEMRRMMKERDEARREVCHLTAELDMINHTSVTAESIAEEYEWDCFKNM